VLPKKSRNLHAVQYGNIEHAAFSILGNKMNEKHEEAIGV